MTKRIHFRSNEYSLQKHSIHLVIKHKLQIKLFLIVILSKTSNFSHKIAISIYFTKQINQFILR